MKINEPVPEEAMKAQAITLPPLFFRWACMFGIMSRSFFLQTLAFPSLWFIKSVHKTLSLNFWSSSPILLANEWFASSGVASVLLFMKSSANSRLWYFHSWRLLLMSLTVVLGSFFTAVTMFLSSTADVFLDLPVEVCYLVHQWFLSSSGDSKWLYLLLPVFVQLIDFSSSLSFTIAHFYP